MRSPHKCITACAVLLSLILVISTAGATADNRSAEIFNADTYQLPELQFDPSQENVVVSDGLSPVLEEQVAKNSLTGTIAKSSTALKIPVGSIVYHSKDGITTVFDQTGIQILSADDSQAKLIPTPVGMIPATHVYTVPSGSYEYYSENATYIINNNEIVLVKLYEKTRVDDAGSISSLSTGSSDSEQELLESYTVETDQINSTLMAYARIDNPVFYPGQTFTAQWIVPDPPLQSGNLSPAYVSIGLDEMNSYYGYTTWHNFRPIIEYDYDQNAWLMSACSYNRYYIWNWDASCTNKFLIHPGDKIEGRIEYSEDTSSSPTSHQFYAIIGDYNTGLGIRSGSRFPVNTDTISQLNINLQGDLADMNESTIIGNVTFAPVNLPASPTIYAATSNSRLPHLRVENLWPDKIVFHTLDAPAPEGYTFSMTNVMDPPGTADKDRSGFITTQNVSHWLSDKAGWKLLFNKSWENVTKADFGSDGGGLNNATLHWHVGHGGTFEDGSSFLGLQDYPDSYLPASVVEKKWGGKNKWVVLVSCEVLSDESWGNALSTSHGIFGFKTASYNNPALPAAFFHYAVDEKWTLYNSWKTATKEVLGKSTVYTNYIWINGTPVPDKVNGTEIPVSAGVMFKTIKQFNNDHLPGYGTVEPDGDPNNNKSFPDSWNCSEEV